MIEIKDQEIVKISLDNLIGIDKNPKKTMGKMHKTGLHASLKEFGFVGALIVAPDSNGKYIICDGNTRVDELKKFKEFVDGVPCIIRSELADPVKRRKFVVAFDRARKQYDEKKVVQEAQDLISLGEKKEKLEPLFALADLDFSIQQFGEDKGVHLPPMTATLQIDGPEDVIQNCNSLIRSIKGAQGKSGKLQSALEKGQNIDWNDDRAVIIALSIMHKHSEKTLPESSIYHFKNISDRKKAEKLIEHLLVKSKKKK